MPAEPATTVLAAPMPAPAPAPDTLPLHRAEALTDGIYAVAMTLLVIELKLPEGTHVQTSADLGAALAHLAPRAVAWAISFLVLAFFWVGHHRAYAHIRRADGTLVGLNLLQLAFVSLMPFSCALLGEAGTLLAQVIYSLNMTALGIVAWLMVHHIYRHPHLGPVPMPAGRYQGARLRIVGVILISGIAVALTAWLPYSGIGNLAFVLMVLVGRLSRRIEHRAGAAGEGATLA